MSPRRLVSATCVSAQLSQPVKQSTNSSASFERRNIASNEKRDKPRQGVVGKLAELCRIGQLTPRGLQGVGRQGTRTVIKIKQPQPFMTTISLTPRWPVTILERGQFSSWPGCEDLDDAVTATECGAGDIKRGQSFSRARLLSWVRSQVNAGHKVHTVYEACGFGYTLHDELVAAGAHSLVTTPMRLSAERRRKNDRLDARELCVRLARYLDGHAHELKPIRIPSARRTAAARAGTAARVLETRATPAGEPRARAANRVRARDAAAGLGRAAQVEATRAAVQRVCARTTRAGGGADPRVPTGSVEADRPARGAGGRKNVPKVWARSPWPCSTAKSATGNAFNIAKPSAVTPAVVPANTARAGCNASANRPARQQACARAPGRGRLAVCSYGNPTGTRDRSISSRLKHGASLKKKIAVALARQLAIDLWRWRTGRATAAELGWTLNAAAEQPRVKMTRPEL